MTTRFAVTDAGSAALEEARRELVTRLIAGDDRAPAEFIREFYPDVRRFLFACTRDAAEATTLAYETLGDLTLWILSNGYAPTNLVAYLCGAARHRFLAQRRKTQRQEARYAACGTLLSEATRRDAAGLEAEEEGIVIDPRYEALLRIVTSDELQLLVWRSEGVPYRAIAEWLGIGREAAKKRALRLTRRIRAQMGD